MRESLAIYSYCTACHRLFRVAPFVLSHLNKSINSSISCSELRVEHSHSSLAPNAAQSSHLDDPRLIWRLMWRQGRVCLPCTLTSPRLISYRFVFSRLVSCNSWSRSLFVLHTWLASDEEQGHSPQRLPQTSSLSRDDRSLWTPKGWSSLRIKQLTADSQAVCVLISLSLLSKNSACKFIDDVHMQERSKHSVLKKFQFIMTEWH